MRKAGALIGLIASSIGLVDCYLLYEHASRAAQGRWADPSDYENIITASAVGVCLLFFNIILSSIALAKTGRHGATVSGPLMIVLSIAGLVTGWGEEPVIFHFSVLVGGILILFGGMKEPVDGNQPKKVIAPTTLKDSLTAQAKKLKEAFDAGLLNENDYKSKIEELRQKYKEAQAHQPPLSQVSPRPTESNQFIQFISTFAEWSVRLMSKAWQALKPKLSSGASALGEEAKKFSEQNFPEGKPTAEGFFKLAPPIYTLAFGIGSFVASLILAAFLTGSKLGFFVWLMIFWAALFVLLLVAYVKTKGAENNHQKDKDTGS
jgi:uncharacterized membrane protein